MRHFGRIRGLPAARDQKVMRQLRLRDLPPTADKLGTSLVIAMIVMALFWGYQLHQAANERDYLIRTIVFEAAGETEVGKVAVAHVVLNRKKRGRWGDTIKAVVTSPDQFEPWIARRKAIEKLAARDPRYQRARTARSTARMKVTWDGGVRFMRAPIAKQSDPALLGAALFAFLFLVGKLLLDSLPWARNAS